MCIRPNTFLLCIFLFCMFLLYRTDSQVEVQMRIFCVCQNWWIIILFLQSNSLSITIVSQKYQDLLQPNSHDRFSKISRTFYASRKLWIIVVFLLCTLKEKLPIFLIITLLLHIPLLALTDRRNYRQANTLAAHGLEEPFFQLCCCQFLVLAGNRF